jgi:hypothetical protein
VPDHADAQRSDRLPRRARAEIPSGTPITLKAEDPVIITQSLGGSYTVMTPVGFLARVDGKGRRRDRRARRTAEAAATEARRRRSRPGTSSGPATTRRSRSTSWTSAWSTGARLTPSTAGNKIDVKFTLTAPGCGMGDVLREDIKGKLPSIPGVTEADVQVVFDPPWSLQMMSDAAKLQLGMM